MAPNQFYWNLFLTFGLIASTYFLPALLDRGTKIETDIKDLRYNECSDKTEPTTELVAWVKQTTLLKEHAPRKSRTSTTNCDPRFAPHHHYEAEPTPKAMTMKVATLLFIICLSLVSSSVSVAMSFDEKVNVVVQTQNGKVAWSKIVEAVSKEVGADIPLLGEVPIGESFS